ncbi:MAG: type III secretion system inner membrane ring subunit SctD [Desulfovibrio sp.]|nr:type III secretion system inner membrane ring subunit SctD [Desulfovibrio sp.]
MSGETEGQLSPPVVALHVFSGVHLGARITLTPGSWLLGSDDSCDLILHGLASRHALLTVSQGDDVHVRVSVRPEQGHVLLDGKNVSEETFLDCGRAWYLGETCFAWNYPDAVQEAIIPQTAFLTPTDGQGETEEASEAGSTDLDATAAVEETEAEPVDRPQTDSQPDNAQDQSGSADEEPLPESAFQPAHTDEQRTKTSWKQRLRRPLPLLILAILLCVLSFSLTNGPSRAEYPDLVKSILDKAGLTGLGVTTRWPGVEVRGAVTSAAELERVKDAVQQVSFPVYLEVAVDDDMLRAVRDALGVHGFFPVVRMNRDDDEPRVVVAVFMRDALVEADAFATLEKDVPSPPLKERHIVHEKDVASTVLASLQNAQFTNIQPVYLPSRISLVGNVDADRLPVLNKLKAGLSAHFGVPLFGESAVEENASLSGLSSTALTQPERVVQSSDTKKDGEGEHAGDILGGLKLTGVFVAPLEFIITEDGRRFFPGSVLPNGSVLESITTNRLTLRRGDKVLMYNLRGVK